MTPNEIVKELRNKLGLSQSEFAERLGLKQGSYSDIERCRNNISQTVILLLEKQFNVNREWLNNGTGDIFIKPSPVNRILGKDYGSIEFLKNKVIKYYDVDETGNDMEIFNPNAPYKEVLVPPKGLNCFGAVLGAGGTHGWITCLDYKEAHNKTVD